MIAASQSFSAGDILNPLYQAIAGLLTFFYKLVPNYAIAISILTIFVMLLLSPLTLKSTRSMLAMQKLAPEMKKLQQKYKGDRQKLNEEMMALYRENKVSPMGGCLPMILQLPVFFILYQVIRGLTNTVAKVGPGTCPTGTPPRVADPKYILHSSAMWHDLCHSAVHGVPKMMSFGIDLAKSAVQVHGGTAVPYYVLIAIAIGLQYLQIRQLMARNPQAAAANPSMMRIQKLMPLFFGIIYINIPAGVNIYFIVSNLFRIGQQELMFRYDPVVRTTLAGAGGAVVRPTELQRGGGDGLGGARDGGRDREGSLGKGRGDRREVGSGTGSPKAGDPGDRGGTGMAGGGDASTAGASGERGEGSGKREETKPSTPREPFTRQGDGRRAVGGKSASSADGAGGRRRKPHPRSQAKRPRRRR